MNVVKTARLDAPLVRELGILVVSALVLVAGLSLLVGCERADYRAIPGDSIRSGWASPERPSAVAVASSQQDFLVSAAEAALFEIEASRLAVVRGGSPAVKRFADATLRERVAVDTDLQQLAASVGVALPSQMGDALQTRLEVLQQLAGNQFDRA